MYWNGILVEQLSKFKSKLESVFLNKNEPSLQGIFDRVKVSGIRPMAPVQNGGPLNHL